MPTSAARKLLAQHWRAPPPACRRDSASGALGIEIAYAPRGRSRATCSFVRWMAGAMMWLGVSWRSWMMYSPRSVSTGVDAVGLEMIVDGDLLADHRSCPWSPCGRRPRGRWRAPPRAPRRRRRTNAPGRRRPRPSRLEALEIEIEIGQRVVLDVAGLRRAAPRIPAGARPPRRAGRRSASSDARPAPSAAARRPAPLCAFVLEVVAGRVHQHQLRPSPIGGGRRVMPASTSATWRTCTGAPSPRQLAGHVEQAAEIAGEQRVGAGRGDVRGLLARPCGRRSRDT